MRPQHQTSAGLARLILGSLLLWSGFSGPLPAVAQTVTWTGLGADGNWSTTGNWSAAPPATGGALLFSGVTRTTGTNNAAVTSALSLSFLNDGWANRYSGFTLAGNAVSLTGGNSVSTAVVTTGALTDVIGLNLSLDSTTGTNRFDVASGRTLTLSGNLTGSGTLAKTGLGTLRLAGANTATGPTQLLSGSTILDYSTSNTSKLADGASLTLGSATLTQFFGTHAEVVASTSVTGGATITRGYSDASATIQLGALSRSAGGALGVAGSLATTTTGTTNGILPAWLTVTSVNAGDWATVTSGTITAFSSYTTLPTSGFSATTNYSVATGATAVTLAASGTINSLRVNAATSGTLALGGNTLTISSGGLLVVGANAATISGGSLTADAALNYELVNQSYSTSATLFSTISGTIVDNGVNAVSFTKAGPSLTILSGSNTYTGATRIVQGILRVDTLANAAAASALGASTSDAANLVIDGGTLRFATGTTAQSTDRLLSAGVGGATLDSSAGTGGAMVFTNTGAVGFTGVGQRTLAFTGATTGTFAPTIGDGSGGATAVVKSGSNNWTLTGSSGYTGPTTITGGTLTLTGANGALGGSSVTVVGSTLLLDNATTNSNDRLGGSLVLQPTGTVSLTGNSAANTTEALPSLVLDSGAPTVTVTQANAGRVATLSPDSLSRVNAATALVRGTNLGTGTSTGYGQILVGGAAGTGLSFVGATTMANGSNASSTTVRIVPYLLGDFSATGSGTTFVTYDTTLGLRPLAGGQYTALTAGYTTPATRENVGLAATLSLTSGSVAVNSLRFTAAATLNSSSNTALTVESGAILAPNAAGGLGSGFSSVTLGNGTWNEGVVTVPGNTFTVSTPIAVTGGGGLTKSGAGTLLLNASNTFTGDTVVNGGPLTIGASGLLAGGNYSGAIAVQQGATLTFSNTASQTLNGPVTAYGTGVITLSNTGSLVFNAPVTMTISQTFSGSGSQVFNGAVTAAGALTLSGSGSQTFNGPMTVGGGLTLNNPSSIAISGGLTTNSTLSVGANAGSTQISGTWINTNGTGFSISSGKTLTLTNVAYSAPLGVTTVAVSLTGGGALVLNSGTVSMPGFPALDSNGQAIVQTGGLWTGTGSQGGMWIGRNVTGAGASYTITGGTLDLASTGATGVVVAYQNNSILSSGTLTIDGDQALVRLRQTNGAGANIFYGWASGGGTANGTVTLARGEMQFGGETATGTASIPTLNAFLNFGGPSGTATVRPFSSSNGLTLNATRITHTLLGSNVVFNSTDSSGNPSAITVSVPIGESGGSRGLTFAGTGTTTISAAQTYTGTTSLRGGTLRISATDALQSSPLDIAAGATFVAGTSGTATYGLVALSGSGAVSLGVNTLTVGSNNADTTYAGVISGSTNAAFVKAGTGLLTLTGSSTLGGQFTIGNGEIAVATIGNAGTANPLGTSGTVNLGASTTTGTLSYTGAGETSTRVFNLAGSAGGGGAIEANGSAALKLLRSGTVVTAASGNKTLTLTGTSLADNEIGLIANPASSGSMSLVKAGSGRWVLSSSNSFSGAVNIDEGQLVLGADATQTNGSLGTGGASNPGRTIGSATGSGTAALLLKAGVTVSGQVITTPTSGTQTTVLGMIDTFGTGTFSFANSALITLGRDVTLQAASGGTIVFTNPWGISASGSNVRVTVGSAGNAGTVQLGSSLATTGTVDVTNGTLRLAAGGAISNAAAIIVGSPNSLAAVLDVTQQVGTFTTGSTQTLSGTGTLLLDTNTPVSIAGVFSPGNSPGLFTFQGDGSGGLTTLSGTTFMEITGTTRGASDGYDAVNLTSGATLGLGGALQLWFSGTFANDTTFNLFTLTGTGLSGNFTGVSVSGTSGAYTGLSWTQSSGTWTSTNTTGGQALRFSSTDGTLVVVPEPATLALAAIGIGLAGWAAVRRRK